MKTEQPKSTPLDDLRKQALEHYEDAARKVVHYSSFVRNAILNYTPPEFQPPIETMKTEQFVLKEDGKIYWIEKMPATNVFYNQGMNMPGSYNAALQSAIDNAVEVSNQEETLMRICAPLSDDEYGDGIEYFYHVWKMGSGLKSSWLKRLMETPGKLYSLQCSVEKRFCSCWPNTSIKCVCDDKLTALVSFQPPVEEGEKQEGKFAKMFRESSLFKEVSKEGEKGYCTTEELLLIDLFRPFYTRAGDACRRGHNLNGKKMSVSDVYKLLSDLRSEIEKNYTITRKP